MLKKWRGNVNSQLSVYFVNGRENYQMARNKNLNLTIESDIYLPDDQKGVVVIPF